MSVRPGADLMRATSGSRRLAGEIMNDPLYAFSAADLPPLLKQHVREKISLYSIVLSARHEDQSGPPVLGSGTLVTFRGKHCILTAAHVWDEIGKFAFPKLSVPGFPHPRLIRLDALSLQRVARPPERKYGLWGPDLALIVIPDQLAPEIERHAVFYALDKRINDATRSSLMVDRGHWVIFGAPAIHAVAADTGTNITLEAYFGACPVRNLRDGFDYLDLGLDRRVGVSLPLEFGGVSGAGCWHFEVMFDAARGRLGWDKSLMLEGVAFWQQEESGRGFIRCHGRESLYGRLLSDAI